MNPSCCFELPPTILQVSIHRLGNFQQPVDLFVQVIEPPHHCLDACPVPDYLREVDIPLEVSEVVPGWSFCIHPLINAITTSTLAVREISVYCSLRNVKTPGWTPSA
jgi:hypothetical protein